MILHFLNSAAIYSTSTGTRTRTVLVRTVALVRVVATVPVLANGIIYKYNNGTSTGSLLLVLLRRATVALLY